MPIDVNNITNNTAQTKRASDHKHVKIVHSNDAKSTDSSNAGSGTASLSPDSVSLTDAALRIKSLEEKIDRLPIIDTQKVEQIKNSIDNGNFEFNPERVADKMIKFEKELF